MIGAAIRKDMWLLLRDRGALISLFALPVIFMLAFGSMFRFGPDRASPRAIAVWRAPGDARGVQIAGAVEQSPGFAARMVATPEEVRAAVGARDVSAGLVVGASEIEIVVDADAPEQVRGPVQGALTSIVAKALAPEVMAALPPIRVTSPPGKPRPLATISSMQVAVPGNAVLFGFFIALTTAMAFAGERRTGTWRRLLAAPVPRWKALVATLVPYFLVGMLQLAFLFGIGVVVFGMTVAGSVPALIVLSMAVVYCAVALGLLFAAIGGSEKQLGGIGSVVLLVMGMLGGCMMPRMLMPDFMKSLGLGVPHGWALDGYHALLVLPGTGLADVATALAALIAFGTGFAVLGVALFKFER